MSLSGNAENGHVLRGKVNSLGTDVVAEVVAEIKEVFNKEVAEVNAATEAAVKATDNANTAAETAKDAVEEVNKFITFANNNCVNALKGEKRGFGSLLIDDASLVEHDLKVKVEAFETSEENLITEPKLILGKENNNVFFEETGTSIRLMGTSWPTPSSPNVHIGLPDNLIDGVTYYIGLIYVRGNAEAHPLEIGFHCWNDNGSGQSFYLVPQVVWSSSYYDYDNRHLTLMPAPNIDYDMVEIIPVISTSPIGSGGSGDIDLSTVSITLTGTNAETKTVYANTEGVVEGLRSSYPDFTLSTETERILIECEYNLDFKKYINQKFEELNARVSYAVNTVNAELASLTDAGEE